MTYIYICACGLAHLRNTTCSITTGGLSRVLCCANVLIQPSCCNGPHSEWEPSLNIRYSTWWLTWHRIYVAANIIPYANNPCPEVRDPFWEHNDVMITTYITSLIILPVFLTHEKILQKFWSAWARFSLQKIQIKPIYSNLYWK